MDRRSAFNLVGIGLRHPHLDYFQQHINAAGWLEIHSENYFIASSPARQQLRSIREHTDISCHGVGLSLGSVSHVDPSHLTSLVHLVNEIQPTMVSDHLSWSEHGGHHFNDLLPLPYTEEALEVFCRNVLQVQDALQRPLLIENPSSYLRFEHSVIPEWEFLSEVQKRTECRLLLDLNNVHVSCFNHQYDAMTYLSAINANTVDEIHLAGFTKKQFEQGEIWIDTHSDRVSDEVWHLYKSWLEQHGSVATLIEWDLDIPEPEILLEEADKAVSLLLETTHNAKESA
ncbi:DUF692 domain-containing protein [Vibrio sp. E150_011]|uniref:MNIO family bufferin maturase n=1 Tax=Vibrio sp. 10N.261.51.F12 TaxID=3229679 RepID=UPI00354BB13D